MDPSEGLALEGNYGNILFCDNGHLNTCLSSPNTSSMCIKAHHEINNEVIQMLELILKSMK